MCYKKFFLCWWFRVVVFKWKSSKQEWFLPLSYACFLDVEFLKIFILFILFTLLYVYDPLQEQQIICIAEQFFHPLYIESLCRSVCMLCAPRYTFQSVFQIDCAKIYPNQNHKGCFGLWFIFLNSRKTYGPCSYYHYSL